MRIRTFLLLLLTLCLLSACASPDASDGVRVMTLNGPTGFGFAHMMVQNAASDAYAFSVESDASAVSAALLSGNADIAALPTNAAAALYAKTEGGIRVIALNTLGVLHLVTADPAIRSLEDLAGKTVFAPAQNPTFITQILLDQLGVRDAVIDNRYAQPADLRTALAAGEVSAAILPEPMVSLACMANDKLRSVCDLSSVWERFFPENSLAQGCLVVRSAFADAHPALLEDFLREYAASVTYAVSHPSEAAQEIVQAGILANADATQSAIGGCGLVCLTGDDMREALGAYYAILFKAAPQAVGGALPGDDFYA